MANKKQTKQNNVINMSNFDLRETTSELGGYIDSNIDINLLFIVLFLVGFGLLMVYSASSYVALRDFGNSSYFFRKQIIADVLGIACMIVTLFIPLKKIERFKYPMLGMAYAVIFLVLITSMDIVGEGLHTGDGTVDAKRIKDLLVIRGRAHRRRFRKGRRIAVIPVCFIVISGTITGQTMVRRA